jgi:hypothetical protein
MSKVSRSVTQARDGQVLTGIRSRLQSGPSLPLAGTTYTMAELEALVQGRIDAANAAVVARAQWIDASAHYEAVSQRATAVVRALRQHVMSLYGQDSPVLSEFGFTPPKPASLTQEQQVARAQKAAATRKARRTMGKKQKAAIKGAAGG